MARLPGAFHFLVVVVGGWGGGAGTFLLKIIICIKKWELYWGNIFCRGVANFFCVCVCGGAAAV